MMCLLYCVSCRDSLLRGWELLAICLSFFPPSVKFQSYLEGHVFRCLDTRDHTENVRIHITAREFIAVDFLQARRHLTNSVMLICVVVRFIFVLW